jgi:hypothetical protein
MTNELYHHGILGQKWGVRRYQNEDGSLTDAGRKRYYNSDGSFTNAGKKRLYKDAKKNIWSKNPKKHKRGTALLNELERSEYLKEHASRLDAAKITEKRTYDELIKAERKRDPDVELKAKAYRDAHDETYKYEKQIVKELLGKYGVDKKGDYTEAGFAVMNQLFKNSEQRYAKRSEIKKERLQNAKKTGDYSIDFLETVQNDPVLQKGGKELLKEYSKYLDDPNKYTREFDKSDYFKKNPHLDHEDFSEDFLEHHGILGMKWGVRRYQNSDGSLTDAGRKRYNKGMQRVEKLRAKAEKYDRKSLKAEKSAHRFLFRDAEAAYAKYSKYKYKAIKARKKADKLESKMAELASKTKMKDVDTRIAGSIGGKPSLVSGIKNYVAEKKREKAKAEAVEKRKATIAQKKAHELEKSEALKSGDPVRISAFQNELSNEELRAATDRIRLTATLKAQKEDTIQTGLDKAESIMGKVTKVKNLAEQGIGAWNTAAKIHNSFVEDDDEKWPVIDGSGKKENRKAIKKVIESGDPERIAKLKGKLTVGETTDAIKSINNWKNIEANAAQNASNRAEAASKAEEAKKAAEKAQTDKFERYYQQKAKSDASRDADIERERMDRAFDAGRKYYEKYTSSSNKSTESDSPYFTYEDSSRAQKLLSSFGGQLLLEDKKRK